MLNYCIIALLLLASITSHGQEKKKEKFKILDTLSITEHSINIKGKRIDYTATTGYLSLEKESGEQEAHIFYIAYTKKGIKDPKNRPVTFSFNGGPGSCSVWLHLGVLGPRRILMTDEGESLAPPYQLVDNEYSWLEESDLVFIDPMTTGFSRAETPDKAKKYHGIDGDIKSVGNFIRRYISDNNRWASPKFVIGESYGTTRASGLSKHLIDNYGLYLNGVILVSAVMEFQTLRFNSGNDLPPVLFLPTYAATAYYHKQLGEQYQKMPLEDFLNEVEAFALNDYSVALMKGNTLSDAKRQYIIDKLHAYTGISKTYIDRANLRLVIHKFTRELLREKAEVVGRFDSRYKNRDLNANAEYSAMDPSFQPTILGGFSTLINDYMGRELGFKSHLPYNILTSRVRPWNYGRFQNSYVNTATDLATAMRMNPFMKVWIANGYYDLATPYFATEYTVNHFNLDKKLLDNIQMTYYPAGHMMYLQKKSLIQMKKEASNFYKNAY